MKLDNVAFHNLGAIEPIPGLGENGLVRIPAHVRSQLNERARCVGKEAIGIELQFVTDAPIIDIYVQAMKPEFMPKGFLRVYKGNFFVDSFELTPGLLHTCRVQNPAGYTNIKDSVLNEEGFSSDVWRIICDRAITVIHGIDVHEHDIRPPRQDELPRYHFLAYGSSITNSGMEGYEHVAAGILRMQVQNKGFSGSCQLEPALVDYFLDECAWDFMTCELGINMRGTFTPEEFGLRAAYLVDRLAEAGKPAVLLSTFPNGKTEGIAAQPDDITEREKAYEQILEELVQKADTPKIVLIKGSEIMTDIYGLKSDLVHPTPYGHAIMGVNLAARLKPFLQQNGLV